jgi:hypothetical protein
MSGSGVGEDEHRAFVLFALLPLAAVIVVLTLAR